MCIYVYVVYVSIVAGEHRKLSSTLAGLNLNELVPRFISANSGLYAHYVFNTLDPNRTGIVSFEVSNFNITPNDVP